MVKPSFPGSLLLLKLLSASITSFSEILLSQSCFCSWVKMGRMIFSKKLLTEGSDFCKIFANDLLKNPFHCISPLDLYFLFQVS